jgi:hypothetical protein
VRKAVAIIVLVAAAATIVFRTRHGKDRATKIPTPASKPATHAAASSKRQSNSMFASIDAEDAEFVQQVLPLLRDFFAALDKAEVNPIKGELQFNKVQIHHGRNGTTCRFLIGDSWTATTYVGAGFSGILHFGERGPDNPFRAIGGANTNTLAPTGLSARSKSLNLKRSGLLSVSRIQLEIDRDKVEKPEIYPEQMFDYDSWNVHGPISEKGQRPNQPGKLSCHFQHPGYVLDNRRTGDVFKQR